jgi:hypothetical protein
MTILKKRKFNLYMKKVLLTSLNRKILADLDWETGSRNREGGAISKVESARVVLAPSGAILSRVESRLSNPLYLFLTESEISQHDINMADLHPFLRKLVQKSFIRLDHGITVLFTPGKMVKKEMNVKFFIIKLCSFRLPQNISFRCPKLFQLLQKVA